MASIAKNKITGLYFEKQGDTDKCGIHAINNALGKEVIDLPETECKGGLSEEHLNKLLKPKGYELRRIYFSGNVTKLYPHPWVKKASGKYENGKEWHIYARLPNKDKKKGRNELKLLLNIKTPPILIKTEPKKEGEPGHYTSFATFKSKRILFDSMLEWPIQATEDTLNKTRIHNKQHKIIQAWEIVPPDTPLDDLTKSNIEEEEEPEKPEKPTDVNNPIDLTGGCDLGGGLHGCGQPRKRFRTGDTKAIYLVSSFQPSTLTHYY